MLQLRLSDASSRWVPAGAATLLWALAAASAMLWWLHLPRAEVQSGAAASVASGSAQAPGQQGAARALGHGNAVAASPEVAKRFVLLGVIAADSGQGSALLAVDGQPPQAFVQGQSVADGWRLQSVGAQGVRLSAGQAGDLELALPDRP